MNELTFIRALSKTAGVKDFAQAAAGTTAKYVRDHAQEIGAALVGAAAAGGGQYMLSRPRDGGKRLSLDQSSTRAALRSTQALESQAKKEKRPLTYREELQSAVTPAMARVADADAKHPGKSALLAVPAGALAGLAILKALK
jgi:K+-transporting ATPase c subunit